MAQEGLTLYHISISNWDWGSSSNGKGWNPVFPAFLTSHANLIRNLGIIEPAKLPKLTKSIFKLCYKRFIAQNFNVLAVGGFLKTLQPPPQTENLFAIINILKRSEVITRKNSFIRRK